MTSGNLFFKLMKEDGKRRLWASALTFLTYFFFMPVGCALIISGNEHQKLEELLYLQRILADWFGLDNGFLAALTAGLALIMGVTGFSYLHSKQKVDFYHGIPVSRTKLFLANYMDGILIPLAAYMVNMSLAFIIMGFMGILTSGIFLSAISGFGFFILHYLMLYSFAVLAMILTGNVVVGILGTMVFSVYFPLLILILELLYQGFLKTSYRSGSRVLEMLIDKSSPVAFFIGNIGYWENSSGGERAVRLLAVALIFLAVTAFTLYLYKKRGSEAAGKAMAFGISQAVFRIPIVFVCGLGCGLLFWVIRSESLGWMVFGLLCGTLISHCVIEIIYHFDFKKLFSHRMQLGLCALAAAAVFGIFKYDLFGYDRYLPKEGSLKSAAVTMDYGSSWVDYGTFVKDKDGDNVFNSTSRQDYQMKHMEITDFADVLALAEEGIRQTREGSYDTGRQAYFSVCYRLKSGRKVMRSYTANMKECEELLYAVFDLPEYKEGVYPLLTQEGGDIGTIRLTQEGWKQELRQKEAAVYDEILAVYQEEFRSLSSKTMESESPVAIIQFVTNNQLMTEQDRLKKYTASSWRYNDILDLCRYPLYPSFTKTIELLKANGLGFKSTLAIEDIVRIEIETGQFPGYNYARREDDSYQNELQIIDPAQVRELMKNAVYGEYQFMNPRRSLQDTYIFYAVDKNGMSRRYEILPDMIPEFLSEEIQRMNEAA